ncbi:MAG: metallophosphoesterase [Cellvibrionales bacterium]|nr:metallophosphoesterase [Cellvibrionales bacterium]
MSFTVVQLSDCHLLATKEERLLGLQTHVTFEQVLAQCLSEHTHIDLMVFSGDISNTLDIAPYECIQSCLPKNIETLWMPGNHDECELMLKVFGDNCLTHKQLGNWQITALNSQVVGKVHGHVSETELARFTQHIEEHPNQYHAAFLHHQLLPVGSAWIDAINVDNAESVLKTLETYPQIKWLANGHVHQASTSKHGHFALYSTPSTCFQFLPNSPDFALDIEAMPGYRSFTLFDNGEFETQVHRLPQADLGIDKNANGY